METKEIIEILECEKEDLENLPEEILNDMQDIAGRNEPKAYSRLEELWVKGHLYNTLRDLSESVNLPYETFRSLPFEFQLKIANRFLELSAENKTEEIHKFIADFGFFDDFDNDSNDGDNEETEK